MSQGPKQPSEATAIAELWRVTEKAGTAQVSRDYFRANSRIGDGWNVHWPTFKTFLQAFHDAASEGNDLYYEALVKLVGPEEKARLEY